MAPETLILGVGNEYRRDDAAGLAAARLLARLGLPGRVRVQMASGEGAALMEAWQEAGNVIVIDAVKSGGEPGTIYRFDARATSIPTRFFHYSTHAFSVAEAMELARSLGRLPQRLVVYGIEGKDYTAGQGLSPEVAAAIEIVAARVAKEVQSDA